MELNFKTLHQSSGKQKESRCLVFTSSTKHEIRHFHVVVVQKKRVMHVQSCCFANLLLFCYCFFSCPRCRRRRRLILGSFSNDDGDGNEDVKKAIDRFIEKNNNFARASPFFVNFFTVLARLRRENA